jgi:hypothetical protein
LPSQHTSQKNGSEPKKSHWRRHHVEGLPQSRREKCWGRHPDIDRWVTVTGRYEGANAEKAVPFPGRHPSILVSFVLCPHAAGQRGPKGLVEQPIGAGGTCFYSVSNQGDEGMIGRTLLSLFSSTVLALTSVLILVLAGHLWDRYSQETEALGFNGVYERFLALQAGFPDDPKTYRATEADRAWPTKVVREASALEE